MYLYDHTFHDFHVPESLKYKKFAIHNLTTGGNLQRSQILILLNTTVQQ